MKYTIKTTNLIRNEVDYDGIFETKEQAQKVADYLTSIDKKHLFTVATMEEERQDRIQWYERRLERAKKDLERAKKDLEEVKNGRDW